MPRYSLAISALAMGSPASRQSAFGHAVPIRSQFSPRSGQRRAGSGPNPPLLRRAEKMKAMAVLKFIQQNTDWNAEPNAPEPQVTRNGSNLNISFLMSPSSFGWDGREDVPGLLRFQSCTRWCWDSTNDEGWHAGAGRFARLAPRWGEFYEVIGGARLGENAIPGRIKNQKPKRHFLFYFRDEVIECHAEAWELSCEEHRRSSSD